MKTDEILLLIAVVSFIIFVIWLVRRRKAPDITKLYDPVPILTDREFEFYERLRPVAEEFGLQIFTKIRLADLIVPKPKAENPFWMECFNKIRSKHIDFALADENAAIVMLIELDDSTHDRPDRVERDDFVNAVLENTGYILIRTYGETDEIAELLSD
ncbi:DUF2726 domain-containing protein [Ruminococcus sp. XPD3002]|uniref:DUF2726 domain-containing protein n=1 Tax=Ruminococcus sp. XPD3002 TaxID=1452269 RepID=UPI000918D169|nr:Protein of unknown function [Ruminococcus flavefaciens]